MEIQLHLKMIISPTLNSYLALAVGIIESHSHPLKSSLAKPPWQMHWWKLEMTHKRTNSTQKMNNAKFVIKSAERFWNTQPSPKVVSTTQSVLEFNSSIILITSFKIRTSNQNITCLHFSDC